MSDFRNNNPTDDISYRCLQPWQIDEIYRREREEQGDDGRIQPRIDDGGDPSDPNNKPLYVPPSDPSGGPRGIEKIEYEF